MPYGSKIGVVCCLLVGACASKTQSRVLHVERALESLQKTVARQNEKIRELSDDVFIVKEQAAALETSRATPPLEVVRLEPKPEPEPRPQNEPDAPIIVRISNEGEPERLAVTRVKPPPAHVTRSSSAEKLFQKGLKAVREGKFEQSRDAFTKLIDEHPNHAYADNAHFWLGESHFELRDYLKAIESYTTVVKKFGRSAKAPDAMMKLGKAYENLNRFDKSRGIFEDLVRKYPRSAYAELARTRLK